MRTRTGVDGSGGARCSICDGHLDYSWVVRFSDGSSEHRCTEHLDERFDQKAS